MITIKRHVAAYKIKKVAKCEVIKVKRLLRFEWVIYTNRIRHEFFDFHFSIDFYVIFHARSDDKIAAIFQSHLWVGFKTADSIEKYHKSNRAVLDFTYFFIFYFNPKLTLEI